MIDEVVVTEDVDVLGVGDTEHILLTYHTAQPAPTQWIAVGAMTICGSSRCPSSLLVGVGRTEQIAIRALLGRVPIDMPVRPMRRPEAVANSC